MMEPRVLVAYATKLGSTAELAQATAGVLRERGLRVDVYRAREVVEMDSYDGVVLIAALYIGRLHRDARRFLANRRRWLEKLPQAFLVPGPLENNEKDWAGARGQLTKELARMPWLCPVAVHIAGGVLDPKRLPFPYTLIPALRKMPPKDARNWDAIRASAADVAAKLQSAMSVGA